MAVMVTVLAFFFTGMAIADHPKQGGTLILGRGEDSAGLDPAFETDVNSFMICDNVFDQLVLYADESTDVVPGLASSWDMAADGLSCTFHLRKGVKFHDGTDMNADAVVFSFGRMMKEKTVKFYKDQWDFPARQPPAQYWLSMEMDDTIAGIEAVDDHTVTFRLKRREAPFIANIAMEFAAIVSPAAVLKLGEDFGRNPVGTGPYKFVEWKKNDRIVLEANSGYWDGRPYLDKVIFRMIPENSDRLLELTTGHIDICQILNPEDIDRVKKEAALKLMSQPGMNIGYMSFNHTKPLWQDKRIRQAIAYAVNKKAIIDSIYSGLGQAAKNTIPPNLWGYNDDIQDYPYDPDMAITLLKEADFAGKLKQAGQDKITLWSMPVPRPYNPNGMKVGEAIQADLKKVGIDVELVTFEWGTYLKKQRTQPPEMDLFQLGWMGDNGDPDNFLAVLLDGLAAPNVRIQWKNEEYHEAMLKAKQALTQEDRIKLYRRAQELIHEEVPIINVAHSLEVWAMKKQVLNFKIHPTASIRMHKVWME
jgi:peptide/nickel transport system substrate-binding protein